MDKLSDVDLADILNNISTYLNTAMTLDCDPQGGVEVSDVIVNYCADYAKRTAKRVEQSLGGGNETIGLLGNGTESKR